VLLRSCDVGSVGLCDGVVLGDLVGDGVGGGWDVSLRDLVGGDNVVGHSVLLRDLVGGNNVVGGDVSLRDGVVGGVGLSDGVVLGDLVGGHNVVGGDVGLRHRVVGDDVVGGGVLLSNLLGADNVVGGDVSLRDGVVGGVGGSDSVRSGTDALASHGLARNRLGGGGDRLLGESRRATRGTGVIAIEVVNSMVDKRGVVRAVAGSRVAGFVVHSFVGRAGFDLIVGRRLVGCVGSDVGFRDLVVGGVRGGHGVVGLNGVVSVVRGGDGVVAGDLVVGGVRGGHGWWVVTGW